MQSYLTIVCEPADAVLIAQFAEERKHASILTSLASRSLTRGQLEIALILADRRCRIAPLAEPIDLVLRAEILHRLGHLARALHDIQAALAIEPDDRLANLKLLERGTPDQQRTAANHLIEVEREPGPLIAVLQRLGARAAGQATQSNGRIEGWVAWHGEPALAFTVQDRDQLYHLSVQSDPTHRLAAGLGAAANFIIDAPRSTAGRWFGTALGNAKLDLTRAFSATDADPMPAPPTVIRHPSTPPDPFVTVIIPVFGDFAATRICIDSLIASLTNELRSVRVLVVNDASPEPEMAAYLAALPVDVISNTRNLGFVGAVNAALEACPTGDVVLLNADTVVPMGVIGRLADAAQLSPDIGTVTPLSNNGELTSLPLAFRENPLPSISELERIDRIAQSVAPSLDTAALLDLPSGIGFCLYVTRACLNAVGGLSRLYERGYGEDVHLCLAAREAGFRNVCALSIFVGHVGTRSFGATKRRLVMRNTKQVAARFPEHEAEVAAFVATDPLKPVRHSIGRRLIEGFFGHLIVASLGSANAARHRLRDGTSNGQSSLLILHAGANILVQAFTSDGALQAETTFNWPTDREAWAHLRHSLQANCIEVYDPVAFAALGFNARGTEIDLAVVDAADLANRTGEIAKSAAAAWLKIATVAQRILVPDAAATAFAVTTWPNCAAKITPVVSASPVTVAPAKVAHHPRLGVILLNETANCRDLLRALCATLVRGPDGAPPVVVLGSTADDLALMRSGGTMISGECEPHEVPMLCDIHKLTHLFAVASGAHFGSIVEAAAMATGRPMARFDWSPSVDRVPSPDLWIAPTLDDTAVSRAVAEWMSK